MSKYDQFSNKQILDALEKSENALEALRLLIPGTTNMDGSSLNHIIRKRAKREEFSKDEVERWKRIKKKIKEGSSKRGQKLEQCKQGI